jgi:hypothetical protein
MILGLPEGGASNLLEATVLLHKPVLCAGCNRGGRQT